eukprot:892142-Pleurochrysis_carterae.AAC.1
MASKFSNAGRTHKGQILDFIVIVRNSNASLQLAYGSHPAFSITKKRCVKHVANTLKAKPIGPNTFRHRDSNTEPQTA